MSPEQATADVRVDQRADIYSFGCVAYEMLTGASPFAGRPPQQILAAHVTEAADPVAKRRPSVPPALATLVMKCLEKGPGDRPQSAEEVLAAPRHHFDAEWRYGPDEREPARRAVATHAMVRGGCGPCRVRR